MSKMGSPQAQWLNVGSHTLKTSAVSLSFFGSLVQEEDMAGIEARPTAFSVVVAARDSRRAYASVIALVALAAAVVCVAVLTSGSGGDRFTALAQRHLGSGAPSARMPPTARKTDMLTATENPHDLANSIVDYANAKIKAAQRVEWKNKGAEAERNAYDHSGLSGWAPPDEPGRLVKDHKNMVSTFGPRQGPFVRTDSDTGANGKHEGFFINTQSDDWFHDNDSFMCEPGTYGNYHDGCVDCPPDYFCQGGTIKEECPIGSNSSATSSKITDCKCKPGYTGEDGKDCAMCQEGTFCVGGTAPPSSCPENAKSPPASTNVMQCYCPPSTYGPPGDVCTVCQSNTYCPGGVEVKQCPEDSYSYEGSSSKGQCLCPEGKFQREDGGCSYCKEGYYCPGESQMLSCRSGYTSDTGSKLASDCKKVCVAGEYGEPGDCRECESGSYCAGGVHPTKCTEGANAAPGSTKWSDCKCTAGTFRDGDTFDFKCKKCPADSYCPGDGVKKGCPDGAKSKEGSTGADSCTSEEPSPEAAGVEAPKDQKVASPEALKGGKSAASEQGPTKLAAARAKAESKAERRGAKANQGKGEGDSRGKRSGRGNSHNNGKGRK